MMMLLMMALCSLGKKPFDVFQVSSDSPADAVYIKQERIVAVDAVQLIVRHMLIARPPMMIMIMIRCKNIGTQRYGYY